MPGQAYDNYFYRLYILLESDVTISESGEMKTFWKVAVSVVCVSVICAAAVTWQIHERKLKEAARVCRLSAEQGDAKAQTRLAYMYSHGEGVPQDYTEALLWYRKAADQGDAKGQNGVGYMNAFSQGVPHDYTEALRWFKKSADQGYSKAQFNLGNMYYHGFGVSQDNGEAASWYLKAAEQGDAVAQYDLGRMYYYGYGVRLDRAEANRWYHKAADQGDKYAQRALGLRGRGLGTWSIINIAIMSLYCLWLLKKSLLSGQSLRNRQQRILTMAVIFGLTWVGLRLYRAFGIFPSILTLNAIYFVEFLMVGIVVIILLSLVLPERTKPKGAKIALGIFCVLFIGFNSFAIMHHDLVSLTPAINIFCVINGQLIGLSIPLAIFLWRRHQKTNGDQNLDSEASTSESPDESERESNLV